MRLALATGLSAAVLAVGVVPAVESESRI